MKHDSERSASTEATALPAQSETDTPRAPAHPEVIVDLVGQQAKPVACVAMVRRALQRAGHSSAAARFTDEAFAGPTSEIFATARRYVTLVA